MGYEIDYSSPDGRFWRLASPEGHDGVFLVEGGFSGLVGAGSGSTLKVPGVPGVRVDEFSNESFSGSLVCHVAPRDGESVGEVMRRFRGSFSTSKPGVLGVASGESLGRLWCKVRLAGPIDSPEYHPDETTGFSFEVPLVCDSGLWFQTLASDKAENKVTVTNPGDSWVYPKVRWDGAGGAVVMPSGARFTLPAVKSERVLFLDDSESCVVTDFDGNVDAALWKQLAAVVVPEGVPPGSKKSFTVPAGAWLEWSTGFLDPWT